MNASNNDFDAIVIGSGIGGLVTGGILAEKEGWKVLVLEKEDVIGGKIYTFEHFDGDEKTFRKILRKNHLSTIVDSKPEISELIERKVFSNYIFEGGWHSYINADRSRLSFVASGLGKEMKVHGSKGFRLFADGKWNSFRYLMRNWTQEDFEEGKKVSREMNLMSKEEAGEYDHIDLRSYLKSRTNSENVRNFHEWLAGYETGHDDPKLISAGEHIKTVSMIHCAGNDLEDGSGGQPEGGFNVISRLFKEIIEENGGEIRTGAAVEKIIVENYKATGVQTSNGVINAPRVICNIPMQRSQKVLEDEYWPKEFKLQIEKNKPLSGILGWINTKKPVDPDFKGIYIMPKLPGCSPEDGFSGDVLFGFEDVATYDSTRTPEGEGLMTVWAGLLPDQLHNPELVQKITKGIFTFYNEYYPGFEENLNWYFLTACDELYSITVTPGMIGDKRLPVKHPLVKDLFFTGDSVTQWSFGVSGAIGGAVNCASAATGKDYSTLMPFYMR